MILVKISGEDRPGVTAAITSILGNYDALILDIGQADIHHGLSLGILFQTPSDSAPVLKAILFKTSELGLNVRFSAVSEVEYTNWVNRQGKDVMWLHCLERPLRPNNWVVLPTCWHSSI